MNEQIKELINTIKTDVSGKWVSIDSMSEFANLIVQECAAVALREDHDPYECILKHFGVE